MCLPYSCSYAPGMTLAVSYINSSLIIFLDSLSDSWTLEMILGNGKMSSIFTKFKYTLGLRKKAHPIDP